MFQTRKVTWFVILLFLTACNNPTTPSSTPSSTLTPYPSYLIFVQCPKWSGFDTTKTCYYTEIAHVSEKKFILPLLNWNAAIVDNSASKELSIRVKNCRISIGGVQVVATTPDEKGYLLPPGTYIVTHPKPNFPTCSATIENLLPNNTFHLALARINNAISP